MLSNGSSRHPYYYARVLGIYHVSVQLNNAQSCNHELHQAEFLWVHWYDIDEKAHIGFKAKHQFRVKFWTGSHTFGFVNPANVLHTAHLIPNFSQGYHPFSRAFYCPLPLREGWRWLLVLCQHVSNAYFWN
jgi:hypothetical protein